MRWLSALHAVLAVRMRSKLALLAVVLLAVALVSSCLTRELSDCGQATDYAEVNAPGTLMLLGVGLLALRYRRGSSSGSS